MHFIWLVAATLAASNGAMADLVRQDFRGGQFPEEVFALSERDRRNMSSTSRTACTSPSRGRRRSAWSASPASRTSAATSRSPSATRSCADTPQTGYGIGMALSLVADTPASDNVAVAYRVTPQRGAIYGSDLSFYTQEGKDKHDTRQFGNPPPAPHGRLRLQRVGKEMRYLVAGEEDADFRELRREPFPDAPLKIIRVTADTGGGMGELDVRVTELSVGTPGAAGAAVAPPSAAVAAPGRRGRLIGALVLVGLLLVGGLLAWWAMQGRRRAQQEADAAPPPGPRKKPGARGACVTSRSSSASEDKSIQWWNLRTDQ